MSDLTLASDIILGIEEAMRDAGWSMLLRSIQRGSIDQNNPGAAPTDISVDTAFDGLVFDFDEKYMPGSTVLDGNMMVLVSVDGMSESLIQTIAPVS